MLARCRRNLISLNNTLFDTNRTNHNSRLRHPRLVTTCIAQQSGSHPPQAPPSLSTLNSTSASQIPQEIHIVNKKITRLIRSGRLQEARTFFDGLTHRNIVTWNSMISGYVQQREIVKARKLFDEMPERDVVSWNTIISGYMCCRGGRHLQEARYLFDRMPQRDFVSWNTMISGYARSGRIDEALRLFSSMPERNVVSWNAIISGFLQNGDVKRAIEFFERMPKRDAASLSALVSGLIQNNELDDAARVLFVYGKRDGVCEDLLQAYNTLIAGYGQKGKVDDARKLFDQIPFSADEGSKGIQGFVKNLVSWNSMIMCYVKAGDIVSARELFDQMVERDAVSWNTMITGYVQVSDMEEASSLFSRMPYRDVVSWNSMVSGFSQSGNLELAHRFFGRMPQKNRISWNSIIAGSEKNADYDGAIKLFNEMQAEGEKPDRHTLSSLLSICAESVAVHLGMQIHQLVTKIVVPDIPLNNSLITMYARCGAIVEARTIFDEMKFQKDVISWNAMIGGYASHGYAFEALELFEVMKQLKVRPTYITFISVLSACAHAGLVDQGRSYFKAMTDEFGIEPRVEHFASIVDVMGRYGNVQEAINIIYKMPVEPDKAVWGALLGGCMVHNNVELAQIAAESLFRLDPEDSGPYVSLYNMYVNVGRWDDANKIRMVMEKSKIQKQHGYSRLDSGC
ncbi:hypothetical protein ACH5RR_002478 [Cinchona calisaya]|uniref:Pentatricopeptide repeat-containing protein n=1 Tax=Cinchona calisaya TaxID=153742 RepID=A0ABD3B7M4_9GENT